MKRASLPLAVSVVLGVLLYIAPPAAAGPSAENPNGLPCTDGPDYRGRMRGPWSPGRYDGDPVGIRYSPRWDIFYYAQCLDPGTPGALKMVLDAVIEDGLITKPGCDGGRAIRFDSTGALRLCSDEADSYVRIEGSGDSAVWVVGYYPNGGGGGGGGGSAGGGGGGSPAPAPAPAPKPGKPGPAPSAPGAPFVKNATTGPHDYIVGDDDITHCPAPDPSHPYRDLMFGFDMSRLESAAYTPKYSFAALAQDLPPTDACMRVIASVLGPTQGCLDRQDNFMLDVTRDGYIGYRTWSPNFAHWSWFGYNDEHQDPGDAGPEGKSPNCEKYTGPIVRQ